MTPSPQDAETIRQALSRVRARFEQAESVNDLSTMLQHLVATRDAIIGAAITIKAVEDATRDAALRRNAA